ncbi:hypothetical protein ACI2K6_09125 [Microbacterium sp. NPDC006705]|jgi:hypothetical protein|uniref:hypothetical protein n=1 Tax=Microbacterium TaxID=33882 RepID=UPI00249DCFAE|nr:MULTISPECIES: hypothetical protein [Microbacterium]WHE36175.1 hypothetical protein P6897_00140 [Microbacterium sp. BDGP8]WRK17458.1 hypothetical protein VC184_00140 [Microbacterium plantarum]
MPAWWEQIVHAVTGRVSRHDDLPDLRELPSRAVRLERTHYLVNDRERQSRHPRAYVLRTEVDASRGRGNIAAFSNGRGVGYLPESVAAEMHPLLDDLGGAAVVNGAGVRTGSIRLWVDLPTSSAVRRLVATVSSSRAAG